MGQQNTLQVQHDTVPYCTVATGLITLTVQLYSYVQVFQYGCTLCTGEMEEYKEGQGVKRVHMCTI